MSTASQNRNYGLDLLKILCMFFVIAFHFSDHGSITLTSSQPLTLGWNILAIPRIVGGICNCVFMLVSGYFLYQKKFSIKNVFRLWFQVWFYSVVLGTVCYIWGMEAFSIKSLIKMLFPFTFNEYWFFSTYIVVYLFFPFFNKLIDSLTRKQHQMLIILGLFMSSVLTTFAAASWLEGTNSIFIFVALYFVGAYINKYNITIQRKYALPLSIGILAIDVLSLYAMRVVYRFTGFDCFFFFVWRTHKVLPVLSSIILFCLFKEIKPKCEKLIKFLSPSIFGVYLFHVGRLSVYLFKILFDDSVTYSSWLLLPQMIGAMCSIFVAGILFDKVRNLISEKIVMRWMNPKLDWVNQKLDKFYN